MKADNLILSLSQTVKLIAANGAEKTYLVRGPIGSGKTSMQHTLRKMLGDGYEYVTVDCTQLDVGDVQIPDIDKEMGVVRYLPNVLFVGDGTKPMVICLDEFTKASRPVQNALAPIMLERRAGIRPLPEGSIVWGTGNLGMENVSDQLLPHIKNRVCQIESCPPTVDEWLIWAAENDVIAVMQHHVEENPMVLGTFKEYPEPSDNPYIFHPKEQRDAFTTARSLYLASLELREEVREKVGDLNVTMAAIAGNCGTRFALDLMATVQLGDKLAPWKLIEEAPEKAPLPTDSPAAMMISVHRCKTKVDKYNVPAVMTYVQRMPKELQAIFAKQVMRIPSKATILATHRPFVEWISANNWLMMK